MKKFSSRETLPRAETVNLEGGVVCPAQVLGWGPGRPWKCTGLQLSRGSPTLLPGYSLQSSYGQLMP